MYHKLAFKGITGGRGGDPTHAQRAHFCGLRGRFVALIVTKADLNIVAGTGWLKDLRCQSIPADDNKG